MDARRRATTIAAFRAAACASAILISATLAAAATTEGDLYTVPPGTSRVTYYAHATGHDFSGTSTDVRGSVRLDPTRIASAGGEVRVRASTLDTGIDRRNRNMWELLESDTHPDIVFTLERVEAESGAQTRRGDSAAQTARAPAADGASLPPKATLAGSLEVRGVRKPLSLAVEIEVSGDAIVARGSFPLDMREFGIEPPRAAFIIRTRPAVRVELEVRFQKVE